MRYDLCSCRVPPTVPTCDCRATKVSYISCDELGFTVLQPIYSTTLQCP